MKGKKDIRTKDRVDTKEKETFWTIENEILVIVAKQLISFGNRSICECFVIRNKYLGWITSVNLTLSLKQPQSFILSALIL
jgi:hypothetical protein